MKRGFTLLELIIVITILGILGTLGLGQYGRMIEKARSAEAKAILGDIRKFAVMYRLERNSIMGISAEQLNIGTAPNQIPSTCRSSHYFRYEFSVLADPIIEITADRCASGGKPPDPVAPWTTAYVRLTSDLVIGTDTWSGGY